MAIKPDGDVCVIREQIINDLVTDLTFQFETVDDGTARLRIYGDALPLGNREIIFDKDGKETASGTAMTGLCRASWLKEVKA
jgi:hypothetical protein